MFDLKRRNLFHGGGSSVSQILAPNRRCSTNDTAPLPVEPSSAPSQSEEAATETKNSLDSARELFMLIQALFQLGRISRTSAVEPGAYGR